MNYINELNMFLDMWYLIGETRKGERTFYKIYKIDTEFVYCVQILDKSFNMSREIHKIKISENFSNIEYRRASVKEMLYLGFKRNDLSLNNAGLYLLKCNEDYKIGRSANLEQRIMSISNEMKGCNIELLCYHPCLCMYEKKLHSYFKEKNIYGEWFNLNNDDVLFIKSKSFLDIIKLK